MSKKRSKARRQPQPAARPPATVVVDNPAVSATDDAVVVDASPTPAATETAEGSAHDAAVVMAASSADAVLAADDAVADVRDEVQAGTVAADAPADAVETAAEIPEPTPAPQAIAEIRADAARLAPFDDPGAIRGVLIQVAGGRLLLPNATIAEVLSYAEPEPVGGDVPDWLLGRMRWRGWQLPLVAFSQLADVGTERAGLGTKVVVLKALGEAGKTPYFAILTQGFPRLVTVSKDALAQDADGSDLPRGVLAHVRLNQDAALLPDLESIESLIAEALAQAA